MFQLLNGQYQGVRTVQAHVHTCNTSVDIQCEVMYEDLGVRDGNFFYCPRFRCLKFTQICILWKKKYDDPVSMVI
jgi:hypothetical protein